MSVDETPPEGRLTDQQRDRMRAGLLAAAGGDSGRSRPWLVPVAASAAVGLLVAGITVGGLALRNDDGSAPVAGQGTSSTPPVEPTPSATPARTPSVEPTPATSTDPPPPTYGPGQESCDGEVAQFLPGATMAADAPYGDGFETYLYVTKAQWVVCDTWATVDDGPPTVLQVHPFTPGGLTVAKDLFLISMNFSMKSADGAQFFAAGAPIRGVTAISYRFPTGDTVDATITDAIWSMQYLMPKAPHRIWSDPVVVTVTMDDGTSQQFDLTEMDLCAQANHGC
jgi:hypothetical protein